MTRHTEIEEHESYGLVTFSRAQSSGVDLFGSDIQHNNIFIMEVRQAGLKRDLSRDWTYGRELIFRGFLSPSQFVETMTHLNHGDGTPITIEYVTGDEKPHRDSPPVKNKREQFEAEVADHMDEAIQMLDRLKDTIKTQKGKKEVDLIKQQLLSNLPFVEEQFSRQMDKTVTEAKAEVEAFAVNRALGTSAPPTLRELPKGGQ